jgi:hypothetical protein
MDDADKRELLTLVRGWLMSPGYPTKKVVADAIFDAHNGRPDGYLVTNDNQWMFRQYRNSVSGNAATLMTEAMALKENE